MRKNGFTLTELIIVITCLIILFGLVSLNLSGIYRRPLRTGTLDILIADIKSQQLKAMTGDSPGGTLTSYGIYFTDNSYILFKGLVYSPGDPNNFIVNLDPGFSLTNITLSSSQIVFQKGSGEIIGWSSGHDGLTLLDSENNVSNTIRFNKYGATY